MTARFFLLFSFLSCTGVAFSQQAVIQGYTPKPQAVSSVRNPLINLNGEWNFCATPPKKFWQSIDVRKPSWKPIQVPGEWLMQNFTVEPKTRAAYFKEITFPEDWKNKRILLKCDGLYSDAQVFLNGKLAGTHQGGFTPAEFDLTSLIKTGKVNHLVIGLVSESLADTLASASQYAAHQLGGITRKLELFAVPETYISQCLLSTDLDDSYRDAYLNLDVVIKNAGRTSSAPLELEVSLAPEDKDSPAILTRSVVIEKVLPLGNARKQISLKVFSPAKWDPEHPNLFKAVIRLKSSGEVIETLHYRFGFKETIVAGNQVFVNGKPIKLRGVCRHEVHPTRGRSLTMEEWKTDVRLFKEANVNYIRTSHYPPAEEFITLCDSVGLFVELEAPHCWVGHEANSNWETTDPHDSKYFPLIRQQVLESVTQYRNHPSVLMWSLANESQWGPIWDSVLHEVNSIDPTRPVSFHDQAYGEYNNVGSRAVQIANIHYPGPAGPEMAWKYERPLLFGEYCHLNCYNRQETITDPGVRDDWGRGLELMWENMYHSRGNLGGAIWSGIDDIFFLPGGKAVGYGEWGPIDVWRRPKPEYWHLKKTYSPVKIGITSLPLPAKGKPICIAVENRNLFSNLNEMDIRWKVGNETGSSSARAEPGQTGLLTIQPRSEMKAGDLLEISIFSPQKFLIDSYLIRFGERLEITPVRMAAGTEPELLIQGNRVVITANDFEWIFDARTGKLIEAGKPGMLVLSGNPQLQMLPLTTGPCVTDYKLDIEPLNNVCAYDSSKLTGTGKENGNIWLKTEISYSEAEGLLTWVFEPNGKTTVKYELKSKIDINPRQIGFVFSLPREYEKLSWERIAQWTVYPDDHIGRPIGVAYPFPTDATGKRQFGIKPSWSWSSDISAMGSNDFKASREKVLWAGLTDRENHGLNIISAGSDAVRSWVEPDYVHLLVASFFTGGGDLFFSSHHQKERKPLKKGDPITGIINLNLK